MGEKVRELKRQQAADQCKVVAHLARVIAAVHEDYEKLLRADAFESLLDQVGNRTAILMEQMGEILNDMDAASSDDEWTKSIFEARSDFGWGQHE